MWKNRVFIGEGPRFPSIFRYFPVKKWSKKRSNLLSWQGRKQGRKSGKNAVLPGGGPPREIWHFARSLPKTLHFFATFPIARNCKFYIPWQPRKPSKFDGFLGVRKHAKLGQNLRFFPIFEASGTRSKLLFLPCFGPSKFDDFLEFFVRSQLGISRFCAKSRKLVRHTILQLFPEILKFLKFFIPWLNPENSQ